MSEIKIHRKRLRDVLMSSEFFAIVGSDALESSYPLEQFNDGLAHQLACLAATLRRRVKRDLRSVSVTRTP